MPIITLTTDLGTSDYYVGAVKGAIMSQLEDVQIVDISHEVKQFDITQAAFMIKNSFRDFPKGSVHILGVRPQQTAQIAHVVVKYEDHYFVGADNGIFSLFLDASPQKVIRLDIMSDSDSDTFPSRDVFAKAACHLARGGAPEVIGKPANTLNQSSTPRPVVDDGLIRGSIIYIDSYGNAVSNISKAQFKEVGKSRPFQINFRMPGYEIKEISKSYLDVIPGERLALFGSAGLLQIAINSGHASNLLGLENGSSISIQFI